MNERRMTFIICLYCQGTRSARPLALYSCLGSRVGGGHMRDVRLVWLLSYTDSAANVFVRGENFQFYSTRCARFLTARNKKNTIDQIDNHNIRKPLPCGGLSWSLLLFWKDHIICHVVTCQDCRGPRCHVVEI